MTKKYIFRHEGWRKFEEHLKKKGRYTLDEANKRLIADILDIASTKYAKIRKDTVLYRARIGYYLPPRPFWPEKTSSSYPHPLHYTKMGKAPTDASQDGRMNPTGISYLYLSDKEKTGLAEVKPNLGSFVTIGRFTILNTIKVVDLFKEYKSKKQSHPGTDRAHLWDSLCDGFSMPLSSHDSNLDYVPTQYLTELFKGHKYDGVKYKSSIDPNGFNILLFNERNSRCESVTLRFVQSISFTECCISNGNIYLDQGKSEA